MNYVIIIIGSLMLTFLKWKKRRSYNDHIRNFFQSIYIVKTNIAGFLNNELYP